METDQLDFEGTNEVEYSLEFDYGRPGSATRATPEKHLDSPITTGLIERVWRCAKKVLSTVGPNHGWTESVTNELCKDQTYGYNNLSRKTIEYLTFLRSSRILNDEVTILTADRYPKLFSLCENRATNFTADYAFSSSLYNHVINTYVEDLVDVLKPQELKKIRKKLSAPMHLGNFVYSYAVCADLWSSVVDYHRLTVQRPYLVGREKKYEPLIYVAFDGFGLLRVLRKSAFDAGSEVYDNYLLTLEQLQMIQDACLARLNVMTAVHLNLHNGSPRLRSLVEWIIDWQEQCITRYANDGYELVKAPEAIFKTWLNSLSDGDLLRDSSFARTCRKLALKESRLGSTDLTSKLRQFAMSIDNLGDCSELFGLIKLSGHPTVYSKRSAMSVRKEGTPKGNIVPYRVLQMTRCFKHLVLSGYMHVNNGGWPPLTSLPILGTKLRTLYNNRVTTLPFNTYDASDLDTVEFGKFLDFDYSEDYLKLLDDKAICPGASKSTSFWFGDNDETRRLLLKALQLESIDTYEIVERMRTGRFYADEYIVELTQKERELKPEARCFCKLPIKVRCFFTILEYNLGESFFPLFPQQTMSMSNTETKRRLYRMANMINHSNHRNKQTGIFEVDFSRWNLVMRKETIDPISLIIEDCYGLPGAWSQAHRFFPYATIVLTDKNELPEGITPGMHAADWPESELVWRGHYGGFEGIQQKLWTLFTIAMVFHCISDTPASFLMAGQGDNQVLTIIFDVTNDSLNQQAARFLARLELRCQQLNHTVKPEECIDSRTVLTYGKELYVRGTHLMYSLKFLSRTFNRVDSDLPSLGNEISSICATSIMVADTLRSPVRAYLWQILMIRRLFTSRLHSRLYPLENELLRELWERKDLCTFALLLPGSLGGLPVMSFGRFFIKGEVDELSWDVPSVRILSKSFPSLRKDLAALVDGVHSKRRPDLQQLLSDPHSIPVDRPKDNIRLVKDEMSASLPGYTKNKWIKEILSINSRDIRSKRLLRALSLCEPLHPDIMADIFKCSLPGLADRLITRFNMTRTINKVLGSGHFIKDIESSNAQLLQYIRSRHDISSVYLSTSSLINQTDYGICALLRKRWGTKFDNATIGTYCPLSYKLVPKGPGIHGICAASRTQTTSFHTSTGPYPPNFGTKTRQKRSTHGYTIVTGSTTIQDIKELVLIASELDAQDELLEQIDKIIQTRSPWSYQLLKAYFPSVFGGMAAHRHDRMNKRPFSTLGSNTVPTHINFSTDKTGVLSGGHDDYPVVFQEHMLYLSSIFSMVSDADISRNALALVIPIYQNLEPLPGSRVTMTVPHVADVGRVSTSNRLAHVTTLQFATMQQIPPPSFCPYNASVSNMQLVASALLQRSRFRNESILLLRSSVALATELFDLKEVMHIGPAAIFHGCAYYIGIEALFHSVVGPDPLDGQTLHAVIVKLAAAAGANLARIFLHEQIHLYDYCRELNISLVPGQTTASYAAAQCQGRLINLAHDYVESGLYSKSVHRLAIFDDANERIVQIGLRLAVAAVASSFRPLYISNKEVSELLTTCAVSHRLGGAVYAFTSLILIARDLIKKRCVRHASLAFDTRWPRLTVITQGAVEAVRMVRAQRRLPCDYRPPKFDQSVILRPAGRLTWSFESLPYQGFSRVCEHTISPETITSELTRRANQCRSYLCRTKGRNASALSIWISIISTIPRPASALVIGVGRGAIVAALHNLKPCHVVGVDLRSTFPLILQREIDPVPQEVLEVGDPTLFEWSDLTYANANFLTLTNGQVNSLFAPYELICIDIETESDKVLSIVSSVTHAAVLLRVHTCEENIRQFISTVKAHKVWNLTSDKSVHIQTWILYCSPHSTVLSAGNSDRIAFTHRPQWRLTLTRDPTCRTHRLADIVRRTGVDLTSSEVPDLEAAKARMLSWLGGPLDQQTYSEISFCSELLSTIIRIMRHPALSLNDLVNIDDRIIRRHTCLYLANKRDPESIPGFSVT